MGKASRKKHHRSGTINFEPDARKASTRLAQLIAPHAVDGETRSSYEALVALGAIAWNLSLVPAQDRDDLIREAVRAAVIRGIPLTDCWLTDLVERKVSLFPSEERWIESYEVIVQPDGRLAIVVTTISDG
ncbi:MAG TPA: hypothetical protein VN380_08810 [Thermoanaerobaculia bacterium]|nr:hypothetical protein [Thermoanaerobaculia bacterium]